MDTIFTWMDQHKIPYKNKEYLKQACVHTSYLNEHSTVHGDNERLEFIGDAVLQLWVTNALFHHVPEFDEGVMTTLRSQLVREEALAIYCRTLGWDQYLLLGIGEEKSGGRKRNSLLSDLFEAILGAVYLDVGYKYINKILKPLITPVIDAPKEDSVVDYKTKLQECIQADTRKTVTYHLIKTTGPSNNPSFLIEVKLDDIILGRGEGSSKKKAEQQAAKDAFLKMAK
ncbi:ribonuclease-3 [Breznakia sp. PF5-3]|uniref:ribonuclease III n=1 Tax=unclassified Breznakia TaxID=2623764 RepID=UPI0024056AD0|nr:MULTISPECIES: ribonuclease III [unclassified Breznakia]MDF9824666.1 ribonuclease-3 [Breznakia sp. PM6-1]MDF9835651.1 ribonuclease-3 [Breznakia sp. PF5-3]MDF9837684.1 ribonuclease-3 [Breznakia sp. PFB2-8]MDF9859548.1 ribonuclease-3 [Breznakia sp. PH5-24]